MANMNLKTLTFLILVVPLGVVSQVSRGYIPDDGRSLPIRLDDSTAADTILSIPSVSEYPTGMLEPEVMRRVSPLYPPELKRDSATVRVYVKALVNDRGEVVKALVFKSTNRRFNQNALRAAMQWRFKPATNKRKPISAWISIPFRIKP